MSEHDLSLTRHFKAPPARIWKLWEDAGHRQSWWSPVGMRCTEFTHEFRVGGNWQACHLGEESGREFWMGGIYREIVANKRIVFDFAWLRNSVEPDHASLITVTLLPAGEGTQQVFHQASFVTAEARDDHSKGWSECLDRLEGQLAVMA